MQGIKTRILAFKTNSSECVENNVSCNCLSDYIGSGDKCEGEYDSDMYTCNGKGTCNEGPGLNYTCDYQDGSLVIGVNWTLISAM